MNLSLSTQDRYHHLNNNLSFLVHLSRYFGDRRPWSLKNHCSLASPRTKMTYNSTSSASVYRSRDLVKKNVSQYKGVFRRKSQTDAWNAASDAILNSADATWHFMRPASSFSWSHLALWPSERLSHQKPGPQRYCWWVFSLLGCNPKKIDDVIREFCGNTRRTRALSHPISTTCTRSSSSSASWQSSTRPTTAATTTTTTESCRAVLQVH
jgi:hypothetical protein